MAKDPATLWYWNDWHGGTVTMTRHLKGCYMDLLYAQFNNGRLSLSEIKTVLGIDQASWTVLSKKFKQDENGNYYNEKAESERIKREQFTLKQTAVGKLGGRPKITQTKPVGYQNNNPDKTLLENVIVNAIDNENQEKGVQGEKPSTWDVEKHSFLHSGGWEYQFCTSKGISQEIFKQLAAEFISDVELKEDFKTAKELRNHFTNWYNLKSQNNGTDKRAPAGVRTGKDSSKYTLLKKFKQGI